MADPATFYPSRVILALTLQVITAIGFNICMTTAATAIGPLGPFPTRRWIMLVVAMSSRWRSGCRYSGRADSHSDDPVDFARLFMFHLRITTPADSAAAAKDPTMAWRREEDGAQRARSG